MQENSLGALSEGLKIIIRRDWGRGEENALGSSNSLLFDPTTSSFLPSLPARAGRALLCVPKAGLWSWFPQNGDSRDRAHVGGRDLGIKCVRPWGISCPRGGHSSTLSPAPGQLHRMSPRWPGGHKLSIQGHQQKTFLQGLPGERAAPELLPGGCSVPWLLLSTLPFTLGKICFIFFCVCVRSEQASLWAGIVCIN